MFAGSCIHSFHYPFIHVSIFLVLSTSSPIQKFSYSFFIDLSSHLFIFSYIHCSCFHLLTGSFIQSLIFSFTQLFICSLLIFVNLFLVSFAHFHFFDHFIIDSCICLLFFAPTHLIIYFVPCFHLVMYTFIYSWFRLFMFIHSFSDSATTR